MTSREFNQNTSHAKKEAKGGPVFITDRGQTSYVLLSIDDYKYLTCGGEKIADLLALPGIADVEFEAPRLTDLSHPADLS